MTASNRGFRGRSTNPPGRSSVLPDNYGNRKTFDEVRVPPDNIGNKAESDFGEDFVHDSLGNSLEDGPSHHKSGILARVAQSGIKNDPKRRRPERSPMSNSELELDRPPMKVVPKDTIPSLPRLHKCTPDFLGDEYIAKLNADFAKLLGQKTGLAFSFSMKPIGDTASLLENTLEELPQVKKLITQILESNSIKAKVGLAQYRTAAHHFVVFFIGPEHDEQARNKEMIAALRQVVSEYTQKKVKSQVNIFLVLANAKSVIEEHLLKIGAKKVDESF